MRDNIIYSVQKNLEVCFLSLAPLAHERDEGDKRQDDKCDEINGEDRQIRPECLRTDIISTSLLFTPVGTTRITHRSLEPEQRQDRCRRDLYINSKLEREKKRFRLSPDKHLHIIRCRKPQTLWSISWRYRTSFTSRASNAAWKKDPVWIQATNSGTLSRLISNPANSRLQSKNKSIDRQPYTSHPP
jgi:hypothetical protein